jgi:type I restriction enzyme M protein
VSFFRTHTEIVKTYTGLAAIEKEADEALPQKVFDNSDFGYHKVTIERPKRLKAQFTENALPITL